MENRIVVARVKEIMEMGAMCVGPQKGNMRDLVLVETYRVSTTSVLISRL